MQSLFLKIKKNFAYLALIAIYFFFINIEAQKERDSYQKINKNNEIKELTENEDSTIYQSNETIPITIIPYQQ